MDPVVRPTELHPGVTQLLIDRAAALNALNAAVLDQLSVQLDTAVRGGAKAVVIRGSGERAFVAGADIAVLKDASGPGADTARAGEFLRLGIRVMDQIENLPVPVIACVDGFCLGGGLELALSCDLIVASDRSKFSLPETTLGVIPGFGGTQRLPRRVGIGTARRMILTGEMISAPDALAAGLVDWVVDSAQLSGKVLELGALFAERSTLSLQAAKQALKAADASGKEGGLREEERIFLELLKSPGAREGLSAFLEKRKPNFNA